MSAYPDHFDQLVDEAVERRKVAASAKEHAARASAPTRACVPAYTKGLKVLDGEAIASGATVELKAAASIEPTAIEWLWPGWLAQGRLHLLAGAPGAGKTTIALAMAAAISNGDCWPDGSRAPVGNIVMWSGEDDAADTLVPRLEAAGADRSRIFFVGRTREDRVLRPFDPARDMPALADALKKAGDVKLVIIDPVAMVAVRDSHRNAETRRDLQPVVDLCRETGAAALGIHHFAKGSAGREPQERLIGSIAFSAMARVVMVAARTTTSDGSPPKNVLLRAKSNIGPDAGGFEYVIGQAALPDHPGLFASRVDWGVRIEGHAREVLAEAERPAQDQGPLEEAGAFLRAILANGPLSATEVLKAATAEGIAGTTLKRAKAKLGVVSSRVGFGPGGECKWSLPDVN